MVPVHVPKLTDKHSTLNFTPVNPCFGHRSQTLLLNCTFICANVLVQLSIALPSTAGQENGKAFGLVVSSPFMLQWHYYNTVSS